jgi:TatD DNase family protein
VFIDTHSHLDDERFDGDLDDVIVRARDGGIEAIICPGVTADSSRAVVRLAEKYETVHAAVAIHPNRCAEAGPEDWVAALADHPRVVAVGETGLDKHWDFTPFEVQQDYFDRHIRLAAERDLPLIVHSRETDAEVTAMLRQAADRAAIHGVIHSFSGSAEMAHDCLAMGFYLSFSGSVTYRNKKFQPLRAVAAEVPDERILIETDSPYLVPHPLRSKQRRNEPALLVHVAECLAELRGQSVDEIAAQTTANARRLFRLV